jgi:WhiB family redox-sensing transcriptional regulator
MFVERRDRTIRDAACVAADLGAAYAVRAGPDDAPGREVDDWRYRAACRGEDPELFFPIGAAGPALVQIARAKQVCARCPVRAACLRYALVTGEDYGIWGGLTEDERRQLDCRGARGHPAAGARALC